MMIRSVTFLALITGIFLTPSTYIHAQSVDLIIEKHIEASGGAENLNNLNAIIYKGNAEMGPNKADFTIKQLKPDYVLTSIELNSFQMHQLYDGYKGWVIQTINGQSSTQEMDEAATARIQLQGDLQGPLVNHDKPGTNVTFESFSDEYDEPMIKLKVSYDDGRPEQFYYLDIDTFLTRRTKVVETISAPEDSNAPDEEMVVETVMDDYRNVDGFMLPFSLTTFSNGQKVSVLKMSAVEINPGNLSASDFEVQNLVNY